MDWIEIIQLRTYTPKEKDQAIGAFRQLSPPNKTEDLIRIALFQGGSLQNELSIWIRWQSQYPNNGKSELGCQLASAFSDFGQIYHSGWSKLNELNIEEWRNIHANQTLL